MPFFFKKKNGYIQQRNGCAMDDFFVQQTITLKHDKKACLNAKYSAPRSSGGTVSPAVLFFILLRMRKKKKEL